MIAARARLMVAAGLLLHAIDAGAQGVTLSTSSPCYAPGETVSFVLTNSRDAPIYMPHVPVWTATTFEISGSCPTTGVQGIQWHRFKNLFR